MSSAATLSAAHLERAAYVYIRQSSESQVQNNVERQRLQYALADHAKGLGFRDITIIDDDLGISGAGVHRPGFDALLEAVCKGRVGLVLSIEASRLSRNGREWHTLLDFCAIVGCLVGDRDRLYDPALIDDRMYLGLKGQFNKWSALHFDINGKRTVMESWSAPALQTQCARPKSLSISIRSPLRHSMTRGERQWGFLTRAVHDRERA